MRRIGVTPHVAAQNSARSGGSAIDGRTTRHEGYTKSINARRGIEKVFGWAAFSAGIAGDGGGMNRRLPRGVARRQRSRAAQTGQNA